MDQKREKVIIHSIDRLTPGKKHAWCNTNVGIIRKHLNSIPTSVLKLYAILHGRLE